MDETQSNKLLTKMEMHSIFGNIEQIYQVRNCLTIPLKHGHTTDRNLLQVATDFLKYFPLF